MNFTRKKPQHNNFYSSKLFRYLTKFCIEINPGFAILSQFIVVVLLPLYTNILFYDVDFYSVLLVPTISMSEYVYRS